MDMIKTVKEWVAAKEALQTKAVELRAVVEDGGLRLVAEKMSPMEIQKLVGYLKRNGGKLVTDNKAYGGDGVTGNWWIETPCVSLYGGFVVKGGERPFHLKIMLEAFNKK